MYLTQMLLDQKNRQTLAALASPSKFHGAIFGLLAAAFSTESRIRVTIDSDSGFSTRIFS